MGIALWLGAGVAAFVVARLLPLRRGRGWLVELLAALLASSAAGLVATALDFGGWQEPDWGAGVFAFLGAFAAAGFARAFRKNPRMGTVPRAKPGGPS
jgi:uncharacterized membrane protein YeaQ/YmgE (transglycosylase-associated protein family)